MAEEIGFRNISKADGSQGEDAGYTIVLDGNSDAVPGGTAESVPSDGRGGPVMLKTQDIPEQIVRMRRLYSYGSGSFEQKVKNFCRQGRFMKDYEDDAPWDGEFFKYFPTYHDLSVRLLRGYFSWRTQVRDGKYFPVAESLAYIYLYELLWWIGCLGPMDAYLKMADFRENFLDRGYGSDSMRENVDRWMLEFCVIHDLPVSCAQAGLEDAAAEKDKALIRLAQPEKFADDEIVEALLTFSTKRLAASPVVKDSRGRHLLALIWTILSEKYRRNGKSAFELCFGRQMARPWYPLANTLYRSPAPHSDCVYRLSPVRRYVCRSGLWSVVSYDSVGFDRVHFRSVMNESERVLRLKLGLGRPRKADPAQAWVDPYIQMAFEAEQEEIRKARLDAIHIDSRDLKAIREDAALTRDSLLTEDEIDREPEIELAPGMTLEPAPEPAPGAELQAAGTREPQGEAEEQPAPEPEITPGPAPGPETDPALRPELEFGQAAPDPAPQAELEFGQAAETEPALQPIDLDKDERAVLDILLEGEDPGRFLKGKRLLASVVADRINEKFYEFVGDSVVDCEDESILLVEDYIDDVKSILGD